MATVDTPDNQNEGVLNWPFDLLNYRSTSQATGCPGGLAAPNACLFLPLLSAPPVSGNAIHGVVNLGIVLSTPESSVYFLLRSQTPALNINLTKPPQNS